MSRHGRWIAGGHECADDGAGCRGRRWDVQLTDSSGRSRSRKGRGEGCDGFGDDDDDDDDGTAALRGECLVWAMSGSIEIARKCLFEQVSTEERNNRRGVEEGKVDWVGLVRIIVEWWFVSWLNLTVGCFDGNLRI